MEKEKRFEKGLEDSIGVSRGITIFKDKETGVHYI